MFLARNVIGMLLASKLEGKRYPNLSVLLPGMAVMLGLAILASFMVVVLGLSGLYLIYRALLEHGYTPLESLMMTNALIVTFILLLLAWMHSALENLKSSLLNLVENQAPIASRLSRVGNAFIRGLRGDLPVK